MTLSDILVLHAARVSILVLMTIWPFNLNGESRQVPDSPGPSTMDGRPNPGELSLSGSRNYAPLSSPKPGGFEMFGGIQGLGHSAASGALGDDRFSLLPLYKFMQDKDAPWTSIPKDGILRVAVIPRIRGAGTRGSHRACTFWGTCSPSALTCFSQPSASECETDGPGFSFRGRRN